MRISLLLVLLAASIAPIAASAGTIYRCTDAKGATVFSQVPCGKDAKQVGASGITKTDAAPVSEASDKATLSQLDSKCETESHRILDTYANQFAEANAELGELHKKMAAARSASAQPGEETKVHQQIDTVSTQKTELLGAQDREIAALHGKCQAEREMELKRQADRNAARTVVKR